MGSRLSEDPLDRTMVLATDSSVRLSVVRPRLMFRKPGLQESAQDCQSSPL